MQGQNAKVWERKPPAYSTVSGKDGKRPLLADSGRANLRKVFVNGQRAKEVVWRTTLWPIPGDFPSFDDKTLARLIEQCPIDAVSDESLRETLLKRRALFAPAAKCAASRRVQQILRSNGHRRKSPPRDRHTLPLRGSVRLKRSSEASRAQRRFIRTAACAAAGEHAVDRHGWNTPNAVFVCLLRNLGLVHVENLDFA